MNANFINNSQQSGQNDSQNNTVTIQNNNNTQSLFKVFKKGSQNASVSINKNSEREKIEKENNEISEKIKASEKSKDDGIFHLLFNYKLKIYLNLLIIRKFEIEQIIHFQDF